MFRIVLCFLVLVPGCLKKDTSFVLILDKNDQPLPSCISLDLEGRKALSLSLRCLPSALPSILLCADGVLVDFHYQTEEACRRQEAYQRANF